MPSVDNINWRQQQIATDTDGAKAGQCALGVRYMMERLGWSREGMQGHGKDWLNFDKWDNQQNDEWLRVSVHPDDAPVGSIVAWDGGGGAATAGRTFGHVEMKGLDGEGNTKWYSDAARNNWGGSRRHHVGDHDRFAIFVRRDQLTADEISSIEANAASNDDPDGVYKHAKIFEGRETSRRLEGGGVRQDLLVRWNSDETDIIAPGQATWDEFNSIFAVAAIGFLAQLFGVDQHHTAAEGSLWPGLTAKNDFKKAHDFDPSQQNITPDQDAAAKADRKGVDKTDSTFNHKF